MALNKRYPRDSQPRFRKIQDNSSCTIYRSNDNLYDTIYYKKTHVIDYISRPGEHMFKKERLC